MKKVLLVTLILMLAFALLLTGCSNGDKTDSTNTDTTDTSDTGDSTATNDESITLTLASFFPSSAGFSTNVLDYLSQQMEEQTNGRITIEVYPGETLLTNAEAHDGTVASATDIGLTYMAINAGRYPLSSIFELPYDYESAEAVSYAYSDFYNEYSDQFTEFSDVKVLWMYGAGPGVLLSHTKYTDIDSLKGVQISVNSTLANSVAALGATPVTLGMAENYEAIRTGVVDSYIGAYESIAAFGYQDIGEYISPYPLLNSTQSLFMNFDSYDRIPEDLKGTFDDVMQQVWVDRVAPFFDTFGKESMQVCADAGIEFYAMEPGTKEEMLSLTAPLLDEYAETLNGQGYDGTAMIARYKELMDQYNAEYPYVYDYLFSE